EPPRVKESSRSRPQLRHLASRTSALEPNTWRIRDTYSVSAPYRTLSKYPTLSRTLRRKKVDAGLSCWKQRPQRVNMILPSGYVLIHPDRDAITSGRLSMNST